MKTISLKISTIVVLILTIFWNTNISAQPGILDLSFNAGTGAFPIKAMLVQNDGKILISGCFRAYNEYPIHHIARLYADGTLDTTFISGLDSLEVSIDAIAIQNDGKIIMGGYFKNFDGVFISNSSVNIVRLLSNGSMDSSFHLELNFTDSFDYIKSILIQSDGKIIIGGWLNPYCGINRLNIDGSMDTTFINQAHISAYEKILLQNDNKVCIIKNNNIIRLNTNGSVDSTFTHGIGADSIIKVINIQNDGKLLVGGDFNSYSGVQQKNIIRLNTNGTVDSSFNAQIKYNNQISNIICQGDGKIIIGIDSLYTTNGYTFKTKLIRVDSNGLPDTTYYSGLGANNKVNNIIIQTDGKILISGDFYKYNNQIANGIARINGGEINVPYNSFSNEIIVYPNPTHNDLYIQSDRLLKSDYEIYSIEGKKVQNGALNDFNSRIDVSNLKNGIYLLNIEGEKIKIVKQ